MRLLPLLALPLLASTIAASDFPEDRGPGLAGQRQGDTTTYAAADFDRVVYALPGDVDVRIGSTWSVRATGPTAAFANLRVVRERGTLEIGHRFKNRSNGDLEPQVHFVVTLPRVAGVVLGGSGRMTVDRVHGPAFKAAVGGSGSLALGAMEVDAAELAIGGSGDITANGTARTLTVSVGGSGNFQAPGLRAREAQIAAAGSGSIRTLVEGEANVSIVGSGRVDLGPRARCTVNRIGSGTVRCG